MVDSYTVPGFSPTHDAGSRVRSVAFLSARFDEASKLSQTRHTSRSASALCLRAVFKQNTPTTQIFTRKKSTALDIRISSVMRFAHRFSRPAGATGNTEEDPSAHASGKPLAYFVANCDRHCSGELLPDIYRARGNIGPSSRWTHCGPPSLPVFWEGYL